MVAIAAGVGLTGCEPKKRESGSATAAKVNHQDISVDQINHVLQQQRGLKAEQVDTAATQILERLINQELAVQKALELKLDREPRVEQQLEAERREVLARAYLDKVGEQAAKPTADEVAKYFEAHPALFKERRIYNLQEINIEAKPDQVAALKAQLQSAKSIGEFIEYLKANDFRFSGAQAVRSAEQLPIASLGAIAAMKDGQAMLNTTPLGAQVIVLAGSRSQPMALDQATPAIEQFLLNARKRELMTSDVKALRKAASVEYVGKFAQSAASAAEATAADGAEAASASRSNETK